MGFQHVFPFNQLNLVDVADVLQVSTGEDSFSSGNTLNVTVPALVMNKTILLFSYESDGGLARERTNRLSGQITSTTNIRFQQALASATEKTIRWYLIEFNTAAAANVQRGSFTQVTADDDETISAVDLNHAFPLVTGRNDGAGQETYSMMRAELTTTTNLNLETHTAASQITEWQVVENPNWDVTKYTGVTSTNPDDQTI
ncbi:MAG: hypothetical protein GY869_30990, partial [Planctomycetes bacterium]|nr:hypothetical protein [Planctomycetota bacterium]